MGNRSGCWQQNQLLALGNSRSRQVLQTQWRKIQQDLLADYQPERDIWPWVDRELYIANVSNDKKNPQGLLLVLPIRRGAFSPEQVLAKLKAGTKKVLSPQQITGTAVFSSPEGHSWAVLEDMVLMSPQVGTNRPSPSGPSISSKSGNFYGLPKCSSRYFYG